MYLIRLNSFRYEDMSKLGTLVNCLQASFATLDRASTRDEKIYWRAFEKDNLEVTIEAKIISQVS
jgi:hypothetical protein